MGKRSIKDVYRLQQEFNNLKSQGLTPKQIAKRLNVHTRTLQRWEQSPLSLDEVLQATGAKVPDRRPQFRQSIPAEDRDREETGNKTFSERLDDLLDLALEGLERLLRFQEVSPKDFLTATRVALEYKKSALAWENPANIYSEDFQELSDFEMARQMLRDLALSPSGSNPAVVRAASSLLKIVEMQAELPTSVLSGEKQESLEVARKEVSQMSADELMQEYKSIIAGNYK